jgi:hypothetical protein
MRFTMARGICNVRLLPNTNRGGPIPEGMESPQAAVSELLSLVSAPIPELSLVHNHSVLAL